MIEDILGLDPDRKNEIITAGLCKDIDLADRTKSRKGNIRSTKTCNSFTKDFFFYFNFQHCLTILTYFSVDRNIM